MDGRPELMDGEKFVEELGPHPLSFLGLYMVFLYLVILGSVYGLLHQDIVAYFTDLFFVEVAGVWTAISIWWFLLIIPGVVIALLRITWKWLALYIGLAIILTVLKMYTWVELPHMNIVLVLVGLVGLFSSDYYRRKHSFYLTDQRIITELDFLGKKTRSLMYSRINDLVIQKPVLGNWLGFGTILPITASGFGLSDDKSFAGAGVGGYGRGLGGGIGFGGLKGMQDARGRPYYILYGVREPERIYRKISEFIQKTESSPYLEKISKDVEKLTERNNKKQTGDEISEDKESKDNKAS